MEETDLISELPDCLLHHILYYVGMVYAVRTCALSKRWRYLWTSMPYLFFPASVRIVEQKGQRDYVKFIDKVMSVRNRSSARIHTTRIRKACFYDCVSSDVIENWFNISVQHSVVVLDIGIRPHKKIKLPNSLFNCQSLETLSFCLDQYRLAGSALNLIQLPLGSVDLPVLRTLRLEQLTFYAKDINNLIPRCPALETLVISTCAPIGSDNLIVNSPQLKRLEISWTREDVTVTIITPNLTTFHFKCDNVNMMGNFCLSDMVSPMVEAEMDLLACRNVNTLDCIKFLPSMRNCLVEISKVKALSLKLPHPLFQAMFDPTQGCYFATPFFEVRILKLTTFVGHQGLSRSHLLEMCPNLETLVLDMINIPGKVSSMDKEFIHMKLPLKEHISHHLNLSKKNFSSSQAC